jgi:uncharacterized protein (TIGR03435 family)
MKQLAVLAIAGGLFCSSQMQGQSREFEVASIKPTKLLGEGVRSACHGIDSKFAANDLAATVPLGRCVISSGRLSHMIGVAYNVTMDVLKGGPQWVMTGDDRYDLEAKVEDPSTATEAELLGMLQRLLTDRFKLKFHRETNEIDGFALVIAKNGPKIREAKDDEEEKISLGMAGAQDVADVKKALAGDQDGARPMLMTLSAQKVSMARLAQLIQGFARGHVVDETNLKGFYDVKLVLESGQAPSGPLQEQLGLKLEPRKGFVEFMVIEYAEKPAAN